MKHVLAISCCLIALTSAGGVVLSEVHSQFALPAVVKAVGVKTPRGPVMLAPAAEAAFVTPEVVAFAPGGDARFEMTALSVPAASVTPISAQTAIAAELEPTNVRVSLRPRLRPSQTLRASAPADVATDFASARASQPKVIPEPARAEQVAALVRYPTAERAAPVVRKTPKSTFSLREIVRIDVLRPRFTPETERRSQKSAGIRGVVSSWTGGGSEHEMGTQHGVYR